ncbi:MAG TPA: hypothetical protein PKC45_18850 [Gemmatales bacterium]|nr:hypothetical protein [Gemmatales bacterium]
MAVEAKFIRNWANSLYNPASKWGSSWLGDKVRQFFIGQVKDYLHGFTHLNIVSNNVEFIKHAKTMLAAAGVDLKRITFLLVP